METVILFRPVGKNELALIETSDFSAFPPRLAEQPIFYPVTNEAYAARIARDWNAKYNADKTGYVTRFAVRKDFLDRYERKSSAAASTKNTGFRQRIWKNLTGISSGKSKL